METGPSCIGTTKVISGLQIIKSTMFVQLKTRLRIDQIFYLFDLQHVHAECLTETF